MLYLLGYLLGLLGGVEIDLTKFFFGYLVFGTAHLSVSFSNDYFDRYSDRNSVKTSFSGGSKVLVEHPKLECLALKFSFILLCFSIITNIIFTIIYGYNFWFFIFTLLGALLGWFYTAPPVKLSYRGLSEMSTMLAVGFFMPGMGYLVASGTIDSLFLFLILPLSCYGLFFIITVELPDLESDSLGNKRNIVVNLGRTTGKFVTVVATLAGTLLLIGFLLFGTYSEMIDWTPFVIFSVLPLLASITGFLWHTSNRRVLVRQVMFNIASMIGFLFLINLSLILQIF